MDWRWTARRLLISGFLILHIGATVLWVLPSCPLRHRAFPFMSYYMMPLGLWQYWTMFAPDPVHDTVTAEAQITDAKGIRHTFPFPRIADYTPWQAIPRFRYSKYAANLIDGEFERTRDFALRHAVRELRLCADVFPVEAHLVYQLRVTPPPGSPPVDPMTPTKTVVIGHYEYKTAAEVYP